MSELRPIMQLRVQGFDSASGCALRETLQGIAQLCRAQGMTVEVVELGPSPMRTGVRTTVFMRTTPHIHVPGEKR